MRAARLRLATFNALVLTAGLALAGCSRMPGRPGPGPEVVRPDEILDFATLYQGNCAACHGENGRNGAAISLANPVYLAVVGEDNLRQIAAMGVRGKLMPPFAKSAGGMLDDRQISVLANGMMQQWSKPDLFAGQSVPQYRATLTGDAARGQQAFVSFCARCHGTGGEGSSGEGSSGGGSKGEGEGKSGTGKIGSIVDASYLALISDQDLRSITIAGRPDEGMPDWRSDGEQPLTDQQITDIVAWLASKRIPDPGQPYPTKP
jgi:mono/diheme cytochrome c family protein